MKHDTEKHSIEQKKHKQKGASMIEYALVLAAVVGVATFFFGSDGSITNAMESKLNAVATELNTPATE